MDGSSGEVVVVEKSWEGEMPGTLELRLKLSSGELLALRWDDTYAYVGLRLFSADESDTEGCDVAYEDTRLAKSTLVPLCAEVAARAEEWRDANAHEYSAAGEP